MCLRDLSGKFAYQDQRRRVQHVVCDRLADDRDQDECRYIMRFWWQLLSSGTEVTLQQLKEHVHEPKLAAIEGLIAAIRSSSEEVEAWIRTTEEAFPIAFDRGGSMSLGLRRPDEADAGA